MSDIQNTIQEQITSTPIVLYMKGTEHFPQCGFSSQLIHILKECKANFTAHNVLENDDLRQGIKAFTNWPTIPQLYIQGEFVGGCDIVTELFESGELKKIIEKASINQ